MGYETVSYLGARANPVLWPQHMSLDATAQIDGVGFGGAFAQGSATNAWGTADLARYIPIRIKRQVRAVKMWFASGATGTDTVDIGVFDRTGTKIVSSGLTAKAATSEYKVFDITDTVLEPDLYYVGMTCTSSTATFIQYNLTNTPDVSAQGLRSQQLGAGAALPSTATWVITGTNALVPRCGIVLDATIV